jgi:hypothetical protein
MKKPAELPAEEAKPAAAEPVDWIHIIDELADIVQRARGIEAAIFGTMETLDRDTIKGVHALYLDHLGALTSFKERFEEDWAERERPDRPA